MTARPGIGNGGAGWADRVRGTIGAALCVVLGGCASTEPAQPNILVIVAIEVHKMGTLRAAPCRQFNDCA